MIHEDKLLQELAQALQPEPVEPSEEEIAALRRAVSRHFGDAPASRPFWGRLRGFRSPATSATMAPPSSRRPMGMMVAAAALAAVGVIVVGTRAPGPSRTPVQAIGLADEAPELTQTQVAMEGVRAALAARDEAGVERSAADLRRHLGRLGEGDLRAVGGEAKTLLVQADAFMVTVSVDPQGPVKVELTMGPRKRPAPESSCNHADDDGDAEATPPDTDDTDDTDDADDADDIASKPPQERDWAHDRDARAAERARAEALRQAARVREEALRSQREAERARDRALREADRVREEALRESRRETDRALKAVARAHDKAMQEASRAREEAQREAQKARDEALKELDKALRERGKSWGGPGEPWFEIRTAPSWLEGVGAAQKKPPHHCPERGEDDDDAPHGDE